MNEANKAAAAKFLATVGSGDVEGFKSVVTTDLIVTTAGYAKISGVRNYEQMIGLTSAFPQITKSGLSFEVLHMTAEDDRVACEAQGFSETINGVAYNNQYHFLFFFRNGKIFKLNEYLDTQLADAALGEFL